MTRTAASPSTTNRVRLISLFLIAVISIGFILTQQSSNGQSLTVQARTLGAEISFSTKRQIWRITGATLCTHRPPVVDLTKAQQAQNFTACSPENALPDIAVSEGSLSVGQGARFQVNAEGSGGLRIRRLVVQTEGKSEADANPPIILPNGAPWLPRDELILSPAQWRSAGTLRFDGEITIGHQIEDGTRNYLLDGRYVVRERLMLHRIIELWRDPDPVAIAQDDLFLGDSIRISRLEGLEQAKDILGMARGFLTAATSPDALGFDVVAASTPNQSQVTVRRFQNRATRIEPRWLDRVQNDPMLIALSIIATLAGFIFVRGS